MESFLTEFQMLNNISEQHQSAGKNVYSEVLRKWKAAANKEEETRALLWLGFLPQCLQRKPSRGGPAGRKEVAYRYECALNEDWESLVNLWERDRNSRRRFIKERRQRNADQN